MTRTNYRTLNIQDHPFPMCNLELKFVFTFLKIKTTFIQRISWAFHYTFQIQQTKRKECYVSKTQITLEQRCLILLILLVRITEDTSSTTTTELIHSFLMSIQSMLSMTFAKWRFTVSEDKWEREREREREREEREKRDVWVLSLQNTMKYTCQELRKIKQD